LRDTRRTILLTKTTESGRRFILAAVILLLISGLFSSCQKEEKDLFLKIGLPEEPRSLNLWLGTDANSRKILSLIYQPLYNRHPETLEIIPWLAAADPVFDREKLTYTVKLRTAKWSDGSAFTSEDVLFTKQLFFDFKIPRYYSKWKVIKKIEAPDVRTVVFHLEKPSAIFLSRVLTAPIVSKREWEGVAKAALTKEKPLRSLQDHPVEKPVGTGPFILTEYKKGAYIHMRKNSHFFGIGQTLGGHLLGPHVDDILFRVYGTSDVAILALKKGDIDYYWGDIQPGYIKDLKEQDDVDLYFNKKSAGGGQGIYFDPDSPEFWHPHAFHCSFGKSFLAQPRCKAIRQRVIQGGPDQVCGQDFKRGRLLLADPACGRKWGFCSAQ